MNWISRSTFIFIFTLLQNTFFLFFLNNLSNLSCLQLQSISFCSRWSWDDFSCLSFLSWNIPLTVSVVKIPILMHFLCRVVQLFWNLIWEKKWRTIGIFCPTVLFYKKKNICLNFDSSWWKININFLLSGVKYFVSSLFNSSQKLVYHTIEEMTLESRVNNKHNQAQDRSLWKSIKASKLRGYWGTHGNELNWLS